MAVAAIHFVSWGWAVFALHSQPLMLGTALLAYGLGVRHGFDVDHIAAIDNVARKFVHQGKRFTGIGLFFALGHSAFVVLAALAVAGMAGGLKPFAGIGAVLSTAVSAAFLLLIALVNFTISASTWNLYRRTKINQTRAEVDADTLLRQGGPLAAVLRPAFKLISKSWHMLPLGFLFGVGFDTASEIGLLGLSATAVTQSGSVWLVILFSALFAAGISLVDTADGVLMFGIYDWAADRPMRKLRYNLAITLSSAVIAALISGVETLNLLGNREGLAGGFWDALRTISEHSNAMGFAMVGLFAVTLAISYVVYRARISRNRIYPRQP